MTPTSTWQDLSDPWQAAFEEAWDSWCADCFGIGAVATRDGEIVARGRNRVLEQRSIPGVLADSFTAHAEMNVLAQVSWGQDRLTIHTTLEPCLMCTSAIVMCRVEEVHHAAADPIFTGLRDRLRHEPFVADRWPRSTGPLPDPLARFAQLLPHTFVLRVLGDDAISVRTADADDIARARRVVERGSLGAVRDDGGTVLDALTTVWDDLA